MNWSRLSINQNPFMNIFSYVLIITPPAPAAVAGRGGGGGGGGGGHRGREDAAVVFLWS